MKRYYATTWRIPRVPTLHYAVIDRVRSAPLIYASPKKAREEARRLNDTYGEYFERA